MVPDDGWKWRDFCRDWNKQILAALVVFVLLIAAVLGVEVAQPPNDQVPDGEDTVVTAKGNTTFSGPLIVQGGLQVGNNITLTNGSIINSKGAITMTDSLNVSGQVKAGTLSVTGGTAAFGAAILAQGTVASVGSVAAGTFLQLSAQTGITVSGYITPTGSYQPIRAAAWVSPTLNKGASGYVLILTNTNTENICLVDTGAVMLSADWTAGQYDTIWLLSDGTNWLELARSNN